MPMGMFRLVAKVVTLRARPAGSKSEKMRMVSRMGWPGLAKIGYSRDSVIQRRPAASKAMFIGLRRSGSAATSWISKPAGRWKLFCSRSGASGSVVRTFSAKGSAAWPVGTLRRAIRRRLRIIDRRKANVTFMVWTEITGKMGAGQKKKSMERPFPARIWLCLPDAHRVLHTDRHALVDTATTQIEEA